MKIAKAAQKFTVECLEFTGQKEVSKEVASLSYLTLTISMFKHMGYSKEKLIESINKTWNYVGFKQGLSVPEEETKNAG